MDYRIGAAPGRRFSNEFMEDMSRKLQAREDLESVARSGILPGAGTSNKLHATRMELQRGMLQDRMSNFLQRRPDADDLLRYNILESDYDSVAPNIQKAQKELDAARKRDAITRSLLRRTEKDDLITRNILKDDDHMASSQRRQMEELRRSMVEAKISRAIKPKIRPTKEDLISRGVLTKDVTEKVLGLSGDDAKEILFRLSCRGGLWAEEIEREVDSVLDETPIDFESLEKRIARRPSMQDMKDKNLLKVRGSDPKFVATKNLRKFLDARPTVDDVESSGIYMPDHVPMRRRSMELEGALSAREDRSKLVSKGIIRSPRN